MSGESPEYLDGWDDGFKDGYAEGYKDADQAAGEIFRDLVRWPEDREHRGEEVTAAGVLDQIRFPSPLP